MVTYINKCLYTNRFLSLYEDDEEGLPGVDPRVHDDDDVYLYKLQTRVLTNLYHMFPYRPERHKYKKISIMVRNK
jgi:hypothetical protein